jgi:hypothetical protein
LPCEQGISTPWRITTASNMQSGLGESPDWQRVDMSTHIVVRLPGDLVAMIDGWGE